MVENTRAFIKTKILNICGLIYIGLSMLLTFAILSYSPDNPSINTVVSSDFVIELAWVFIVSDVIYQFLGLAGYLLPLYFLTSGIRLVRGNELARPLKRLFLLLVLVALSAFAASSTGLESVVGRILCKQIQPLYSLKYGAISVYSICLALCIFLFMYVFEVRFKSLWHLLTEFKGRFVAERAGVETEYVDFANDILDIEEKKSTKKSFLSPLQNVTKKSLRKKHTVNHGSNIYMLPPLDLLKNTDTSVARPSKAYYTERSATLLKTLNDFGITGEILGVSPGPVVSLFQFEPSAGIKTARVISLASDIARSMSAKSVRVSLVPGKNIIGIEIPNERRETVALRELLSSSEFEKFPAPLAIALGKSISGESVIVDLAQMPHLLIAGTTGSGKSVAINTMILSLLYRLSPDSCKLILIDPKMLELSVYEGIPHLLTPVVTDPKKAISALKWAVVEMERRYQTMSKIGVRNIYGYNEKINLAIKQGRQAYREVQVGFDDERKPIVEKEYLENELFPNIVIVVDEMADLMMVAGKDIEAAVQRLAQMARAAGIHLIMATQRPSVDVITGTIKANFPTRISFRVSSKIDSRTILGEQGAEHLLGMGDMLYMANAGSLMRVHGPFVSDAEIESVVKYLREQGSPHYAEITSDISMNDDDGGMSEGADEMYNEAVELMRREGKISTSFIQRHLKIGYNRAARIIDQMEAGGVISKPDHVGRRRIVG